jgi:hypothetical protein
MAKFKVGDVIISKHGKYPLEVIRIDYWEDYNLRYLHNGKPHHVDKWNIEANYELYNPSESESTMTNTLYTFKKSDGTDAFGTHIGTNSQNKFLIEEKVTGEIHVLDKKDLEEVLPYTFSAKMGNSENHYIGTPDALKVDDILLCTSGSTPQIAVVTAVDTKNKSAKKFKGAKLATEAI